MQLMRKEVWLVSSRKVRRMSAPLAVARCSLLPLATGVGLKPAARFEPSFWRQMSSMNDKSLVASTPALDLSQSNAALLLSRLQQSHLSNPHLSISNALNNGANIRSHLYTIALAQDRMRMLNQQQQLQPSRVALPNWNAPRMSSSSNSSSNNGSSSALVPPPPNFTGDLLAHPYFSSKFDPRLFRIGPACLDEPKPQHSYIGLIAMAILSSGLEQRLVLADIYQYILDHFPYFRHRGPGWRNSIRHNLSLNECFIKAGRAANGKGNFWAIHPACVDDFRRGDFRRRRAQRKVRRHNGHHVEEDDSPSPPPPPFFSLPQQQQQSPLLACWPLIAARSLAATPASAAATPTSTTATARRKFDVASLLGVVGKSDLDAKRDDNEDAKTDEDKESAIVGNPFLPWLAAAPAPDANRAAQEYLTRYYTHLLANAANNDNKEGNNNNDDDDNVDNNGDNNVDKESMEEERIECHNN